MTANDPMRPDEAQAALDSVEIMGDAGRRRAVPPRLFDIGMPLIVAIGFALYAQKDPGGMPGLVIALGTVLFVVSSREKTGVTSKAAPTTRTGMAAFTVLIVFLLTLFFGGIIVRRTYDLAWVPVATGAIAGLTLFLLNRSERQRLAPTTDGRSHR